MSQADALEEALATLLRVDLPSGPDFHYSNTFSSFREPARTLKADIRRILLHMQGRFGSQQADAGDLDESEEGDAAVGELVEGLLDDLLEKVDASLDRARAQLKTAPGASADVTNPVAAGSAAPGASQIAGKNAAADKRARSAFATAHTDVSFGPRPQDSFDPPVDNRNDPFKPRLGHCALDQGTAGDRGSSLLDAHARKMNIGTAELEIGVHPLEGVLEDLTYQDWQLQASEPQLPQGLDETPLTYVDTPDGLQSLAEALSAAREVAIDLEAHSYRSFQGFCCLMQVSTRSADYLVDVIALRSLVGPCLAPIFADTKVVKVLHGADSDIVWLQRDFGIYVANLFDTGQAARVLALPSAGLAYLLSHFCSVKADKRWQLADWRVRPLSSEALHYARMDTHFLLYIYDCLKVQLAKLPRVPDHLREEVPEHGPVSCMGVVLERSRLLCLQRYEKELFSETSYLDFYRRCQERLTREQLAVFAGLYAWRDRTARERDESTGFVLSRALLLKLAKRPPATARDLRAVLGDQGRRSAPLLVELANEVVEVISNAQQQVDSVPDPDDLPGDRNALSPAAALAARESAVDDAFAAAAAIKAGGGSASADKAEAPDFTAAAAATAAEVRGEPSSRGAAAPSVGSGEAALRRHVSEAGVSGPREDRAAPAPAGPAVAAKPALAPLVAKKLLPLGGAGRAGSGLGSMLAGGQRRTGGLEPLSSSRPETMGTGAAMSTLNVGSAGGGEAARAAERMPAKPNAVAAAATLASFGVPSGLGARLNAAQPVSTFGSPPSGLGAASGASSGRAPSGLGVMLGGRKAQATPGRSSRSGMSAKTALASGAADKTAKAVEELNREFVLPFGLAAAASAEPASEQAVPQDDAPMPQGPAADPTAAETATPEEARAEQAASVREVMEQLRSENRFEVLQSGGRADGASQGGSAGKRGMAEGEELEQPEDYLPLPISEQYKLPGKKARGAAGQSVRFGGRPLSPMKESCSAGGQPDLLDDPPLSPEERERLRCAAEVRATLEAVGLGEEAAAHSLAHEQAKSGSKKQKKRHVDGAPSLGLGIAADELQAKAARSNKTNTQSAHQAHGPAAGDPKEGVAAALERDVIPFDFAAARASAMGLDVSGGIGGRGRGRGGRGSQGGRRGGRERRMGRDRQDEEKDSKRKGFNPWDAIQEEAVKGGKRSVVMPRSGNRTMTFG